MPHKRRRMPDPSPLAFGTLDDALAHAKRNGATHVTTIGRTSWIVWRPSLNYPGHLASAAVWQYDARTYRIDDWILWPHATTLDDTTTL